MARSIFTQEERAELRSQVVKLKEAGRTWNEIAAITGVKKETTRSWYRRLMAKKGPPAAQIDGAVPEDHLVDPEEALSRAKLEWQRTEALLDRQKNQVIRFDYGPVGITFLADQHLGAEGVNYLRCFEEAELITSTPGMYIGLVGDLVDNFIVNKLLWLSLKNRISTSDEAALLKMYLSAVAPRLVCAVSGNHDWWTTMITGIDYFAQSLRDIAPLMLYDQHQLDLQVGVGKARYTGRIRHHWRNYSMYNPTHGIEQAYRVDGAPFVWAVGGHTHVSGLSREFNAGGDTGVALILGSYKRYDQYARRLGFPAPNQSTAVTVIFDEFGMRGESNLQRAVDYFQGVYGSDDDAPDAE